MEGKIKFVGHHIPALKAGIYELDLEQRLTAPGLPKSGVRYPAAFRFAVQSERFSLAPGQINALFPPAGSLGDFSNVLPHVVLNRPTLPWERTICAEEEGQTEDKRLQQIEKYKGVSWLALLVFEEQELVPEGAKGEDAGNAIGGFHFTHEQFKSLEAEIGKLAPYQKAKVDWPGISGKDLEDPDERITVILPTRKVLDPLLLVADDLELLSHLRESDGTEKSVLIANRLPRPGVNTVVHLVSMENRYKDGAFYFQHDDASAIVPLISLKSWRFTSLSARHNFRGLMLHLNHHPLFRMPVDDKLRKNWEQEIPAPVKTAFAKANAHLATDVRLLDTGLKKVQAGPYQYLLGKSGNLYDRAGRHLLTLTNFKPEEKDLVNALKKQAMGKISLPEGQDPELRDCPNEYWWIADEKHQYFLDVERSDLVAYRLFKDESPTLRIPESGDELADPYLQQGYAPMPHFFREGSKALSWYRGPLTPGPQTFRLDPDKKHVNASDHLLHYHEDTGFFDVSMAAAWELGRMLALGDKAFSLKLEKWKRTHRLSLAVEQQQGFYNHLPFGNINKTSQSDLPEELRTWLERLLDLEGVPFNYLVPHEDMLPSESIRYFYLDPNWLYCLYMGAFSLGRPVPTGEGSALDGFFAPQEKVVGFLLRSAIVSGWPDLQIKAYSAQSKEEDPDGSSLPVIRHQLADDILLCLIKGEPAEIDLYLKPAALHFGFHQDGPGEPYRKVLRDERGKEDHSNPIDLNDLGIFNPADRVIAVRPLVDVILRSGLFKKSKKDPDLNAGEFALSLIEGAERFKLRR